MSDEVNKRRTKAEKLRRLWTSKTDELEELTSGRTTIQYESRLAASQKALDKERSRQAESRRQFESQLKLLGDVHPFRQAFLNDPGAAEFVRGDLDWLRLVLVLYGGLADTQLTSYCRQYSEIERVLQMEDATRSAFVERLRKKPYWRQKWEGEDTVYNLAIYLDTECGMGAKSAARATLMFDPVYICFESVLTPTLLEWLHARVPGKSMFGRLLEIARCNDTLLSASALLALLAIDPANIFDELIRRWRDKSRTEVVSILRELIQQRIGLMRDGTVLYRLKTKIFEAELGHVSTLLPDERFEDMLSVFYRALCEAASEPPRPGFLISRMNLPYANAELWATWMSGMSGDPKYDFAVAIDTIGKRIHSADGLANLHRTYAVQFQEFTTWKLDFIPPVWEDPSDKCGEAFTISQESSSQALQELFHEGTIGYSGVLFNEAPDLLTEALAAALMLPDKSFEALLSNFSEELATKSRYEIEQTVIVRARAIGDSVIRSRTLWRLGRYLLQWGEVSLFEEAIVAASNLSDPLQRARAFERLFNDAPHVMRPQLQQGMREAVRQISDANNRVRAICRLAILTGGDESASLWREAVELLGSVENDAKRAETLVLMRKVFADYQMPQDGLDELAETEPEPWYRHKGMGLLSFELVKIHPSMRHATEAVPVVLHALLLDVLALLDRKEESTESWLRLTRHDQQDAAFARVQEDIARSNAGTIPFTRSAHAGLAALVPGEVELAAELLPHLAVERSQVFPELHDWLRHPPHEYFRPYAALMLAESGRMDAENLPHVLELLQSGKDIARYRAAILLHSDDVYIGKPDPRHRASALGLQGVLSISEFALRMTEQGRFGCANTAWWTWVNTEFDSPEILEGLVRCICEDPQRGLAAANVVANLYKLNEASEKRFVELLLSNRSGAAAQALIQGFCSVCNKDLRFSVPVRYQQEVDGYWQALCGELADSIRGLPDRIQSVENVLLNNSEADSLTPAALDAALLSLYQTAPKNSPQELSKCAVYRLTEDPAKALEAAKHIADSALHLRALFVWLQTCLAESIADSTKFVRKRDTLLEIASYCAQHSPAAVFNLIEELDFENLLSKATVYQPTSNGRAGAVALLGFVRNPGRDFLTALKSAIVDVAEVQQSALAMVRRLRYINPAILKDLIDLLDVKDGALIYAASRLLVMIARHEKTGNADRKRIARALSSALKTRSARQTVCAFEYANSKMWISNLGTLAQRHFQSLMEIVGMS